MSWRSAGKIQRKMISISSKNNSKKKGHREKNWARKRGDFLEDSMMPISSWEVGVNFCSTFKAYASAYPEEQH